MTDTGSKAASANRPLFIFELANNHMGSVAHGIRVVRELAEARRGFDFDFALKFQYRRLDTFIHPAYQGRSDIKYVKRFLETRLSPAEFLQIKAEADKAGFIGVCTPFDEPSVDLVEGHGFDYIKIASCSFTDWPLLERVVQSDKPLIASTAGATLDELDRVVSFFDHRSKDFSLMHCVAEYPAPADRLELNQIDLLRTRYPSVRIGYSAHESPDNLDAVKLAVAKGARVFEKHVGVKTDVFPVNDYSATPEQVRRWLGAARDAFAACGTSGRRPPSSQKERATLRALQRGVFVRPGVREGERIVRDNTFLAIPTTDGQVVANDLSKYATLVAKGPIAEEAAVMADAVQKVDLRDKVYQIAKEVNDLLRSAHVHVPGKADLEISHHYGIEKFHEFGCSLITIVNREYCKKLIIVLPGQQHPEQYHKRKVETFHVLHGTVSIRLDGASADYGPGAVVTVEKGVRHFFTSPTGAVIEEISSTHYRDDSFYTDPKIAENKNRKTSLTYWLQAA